MINDYLHFLIISWVIFYLLGVYELINKGDLSASFETIILK